MLVITSSKITYTVPRFRLSVKSPRSVFGIRSSVFGLRSSVLGTGPNTEDRRPNTEDLPRVARDLQNKGRDPGPPGASPGPLTRGEHHHGQSESTDCRWGPAASGSTVRDDRTRPAVRGGGQGGGRPDSDSARGPAPARHCAVGRPSPPAGWLRGAAAHYCRAAGRARAGDGRSGQRRAGGARLPPRSQGLRTQAGRAVHSPARDPCPARG